MESGDVKRAEGEMEDTATPRSNGAIPCLAQAPRLAPVSTKSLPAASSSLRTNRGLCLLQSQPCGLWASMVQHALCLQHRTGPVVVRKGCLLTERSSGKPRLPSGLGQQRNLVSETVCWSSITSACERSRQTVLKTEPDNSN